MGFILEDRPDGIRPNGWYGGQNKKYYDIFNLTSDKKFAYIFDDEKIANDKAKLLNKGGWNFVVLPV